MTRLVKPVRDWLRVVLPGNLADGLMVVVLFFFALLAFRRLVYDSWWLTGITEGFGRGVATFAAAAYAIFRVWYFNPLENCAYGDWLRSSPWRYPQKLLLGPLHFTIQDAVVLVLLAAMSTIAFAEEGERAASELAQTLVIVPCVFFLVQAVTVWSSALAHVERVGVYGIPLLLGVAMQVLTLPALPIGMLLVGFALAIVCHISLQQMVSMFEELPPGNSFLRLKAWFTRESNLAWPVERLLSERNRRLIAPFDALLIAIVVTWLYSSYAHQSLQIPPQPGYEQTELQIAHEYVLFPLMAMSVARLITYCSYYHPPMGIVGRFTTGRLIVPGYDRALVAPLLGVLILAYLPDGLDLLELTALPSIAICMFLGTWILFGMGPTLDDWRHTGHHRIVSGKRSKQLYTAIT